MGNKIKLIISFLLNFFLRLIPKRSHHRVEIFIENLLGYVKKSFSNHDEIVNLKVGSTNFSLKVRKNNLQAHTVYKKMKNENSIYELSILTCLKSILDKTFEKENLFLDIGSFIGYYTCFVAKYKRSKIDIISIESNPDFSKDISEAIKINKITNAEVINETLSDKNSKQYIYREMSIDADSLENSDLDKNLYDKFTKHSFSKNSITLDNLNIKFDKYKNSNIMKIDAHGAEAKILSGANNLLKNISYILLELHTDSDIEIYSPGYNKKQVIENLIKQNFNCYLVSPHADIRTKLRKMNDYRNDYFNYKKKFEYVLIEKDMIEKILFDRNLSDIFILCLKDDVSINELACFN